MPESELNKVKDYTIKAIGERHGEYDFGSYKRGYIYAKENNILENYDYLILCNDSVYGPFFNFKEIVENMESKDTDIYGIFKHLNIAINSNMGGIQSICKVFSFQLKIKYLLIKYSVIFYYRLRKK